MSRAAADWVAHLEDGGTTPWLTFLRDRGSGDTDGAGAGDLLPGAQQLELLRRLNVAGTPGSALSGRVLRAEPRGRGRPPLRLLVPGLPVPAYGGRAVDPQTLEAGELLRVAAVLIAEDLHDTSPAEVPTRRLWTRLAPWHRGYRLAGDPWLLAHARESLTAAGRPPGGRRPVVLVLGAPLDRMVVDCWLARCFSHGGSPWSVFRAGLHHGSLPPRADLGRVVARRVDEVGTDRVEVVLDAGLLPVGRGVGTPPPAVAHHAAELARRVAGALGGMVEPHRQAHLLRGSLLTRLSGVPGPPTSVGAEHHGFLREEAERMRTDVTRAGVTVHGDPAMLRPGEPGPVDHEATTADSALALAVDLLLERSRGGR